MTPTALTPAGRGTKSKPKARSTGHRGAVREQTSPRKPAAPRRVSGPVGGATRTERPTAPARTPIRRAPRRAARPATRIPLRTRAVSFVIALPDHPLLDRIVRGRYWIPILGVLLAGIVAMQVEVLKLSANMGRSIERGTALQSRNEQLRVSVAQLSDDQRIERLAAAMGMVMPDPSAIDFLAVHPAADVRAALANIHQADASGFISSLPAIDTPAGVAAAASSIGITAPAAQATTPTSSVTSAPTDTTAVAPSTATAPSSTGAAAPTTATGQSSTGAAAPTTGMGQSSTGAPVVAPDQTSAAGAATASGG